MEINRETVLNFLQEYFTCYAFSGNDEVHFNSPFFADKKRRLYMNLNTGKWFDQHEQRGGSFQSFVSEVLGVSSDDAKLVIEKEFSTPLAQQKTDIRDVLQSITEKLESEPEKSEIDVENDESESLIDSIHPIMFDDYCQDYDKSRELALEYLNNRKISPSGLGYFPLDDANYQERIFIPFYENNQLVYFVARTFNKVCTLRYKNPNGLSAGDYVFNYDKIEDELIVMEGVFDALSVSAPQVATAMLSNKMKEEQARKIMGISSLKRIIFVPDCDKKPETRKLILNNMIKNYDLLNQFRRPYRRFEFYVYYIPEPYKDFNEYKQGTRNGNIKIEDCEKFSKSSIMLKAMLI